MDSPKSKPKAFTDLPPEIRNRIYEFSIETCNSAKTDIETLDSIRHLPEKDAELVIARSIHRGSPGVLFANRKIMSEMVKMCMTKVTIHFHHLWDLEKAKMLHQRSAAVASYLDLVRRIEFDGFSWKNFRGRVVPDAVFQTFNVLSEVFPQLETLAITIDNKTMSSCSLIKRSVWDLAFEHLQEVKVRNPQCEYRALRAREFAILRHPRSAQHAAALSATRLLLGLERHPFSTIDTNSDDWFEEMGLLRLEALNESLARILICKKEEEAGIGEHRRGGNSVSS